MDFNEALEIIKSYFYMYGMDKNFTWDEENNIITDGEVEYSFTDYSNGEFRSIFMKFCNDPSPIYLEFWLSSYENIDLLVDDAFNSETIDYLDEKVNKYHIERMEKRRQNSLF